VLKAEHRTLNFERRTSLGLNSVAGVVDPGPRPAAVTDCGYSAWPRSTPARRSLGVGWFEVERSTFDVQLFPGLKPFNYKLALLALTCHRDNPASAGFHLNRSPGESADPAALVAELIYVSAQALGVNNPFGEELEMHHLVIVILGE